MESPIPWRRFRSRSRVALNIGHTYLLDSRGWNTQNFRSATALTTRALNEIIPFGAGTNWRQS